MTAAIAWSRHPGAHPPGTSRTGIAGRGSAGLYVALVLGPLDWLSQHALRRPAGHHCRGLADPGRSLVGPTAGPLRFGKRFDTGLVSLAAAAACAVTLLAGSASRRSARWTSAPPHRLRSRRGPRQPDRQQGTPSTSHSSHIGHICSAYRSIHEVADRGDRAADDGAGRTRYRRKTMPSSVFLPLVLVVSAMVAVTGCGTSSGSTAAAAGVAGGGGGDASGSLVMIIRHGEKPSGSTPGVDARGTGTPVR